MMGKKFTLNNDRLTIIRVSDPRVQSYNIEMTELVGGTFWKPYTPEQVAGTEEFPVPKNQEEMIASFRNMFTVQPPIDFSNPRLQTLAAAFGPVIVRLSGSWATGLYYDFDGNTGGEVPEGFANVLTLSQWQGALDFAKTVNAQILVSVANSAGVHENGTGPWQPDQAELLWSAAADRGIKIDYAEFMNEPNVLTNQGLPKGYGTAEFARDHDLFARWLSEKHPETVLVGPCAADSPRTSNVGGGMIQFLQTEDLMNGMNYMPKYYSYHSYAGVSERGVMFGLHYPFSSVLTDDYLTVTMQDLDWNRAICDRYMPGADLWVTESADAGCGGNTWASTFVECFRYLVELAQFNRKTRGVIFHNTLASSAYGLLEAETFIPRPQYWAALLFSRLMGEKVYDTGFEDHVYAQSYCGDENKICWLVLNTSQTEQLELDMPEGTRWLLTSDKLRSQNVYLNGRLLSLEKEDLPDLSGESCPKDRWSIPPLSIAFIVI